MCVFMCERVLLYASFCLLSLVLAHLKTVSEVH